MHSIAGDRLDLQDAVYRHHHTLRQLGDHCVETGHYEEAERCYNEAARLAPDQPGPYVSLGTVYLHAGLLHQAEWTFRIARRIHPDCAEAFGGLAMVHQRREEYPLAFEMYLKCLELDSDNLVALLGLFQTSCQMGTFSMITRHLQRYLKMHPQDASVLFCLGTLYAREGRLGPAREALTQALNLDPDLTDAARLLAAVESRLAADPLKGTAA